MHGNEIMNKLIVCSKSSSRPWDPLGARSGSLALDLFVCFRASWMFWYLLSMAMWGLAVSLHGKNKTKQKNNDTSAMKQHYSGGIEANSHPNP